MISKKNIDTDIPESILEKALLTRFTEEAFLDLFSKGKLFGTVHTCIGQELTGATITEYLKTGDSIFSNHRCHGHFLSRTLDVDGLVAELMGKETGVCKGIGGSQHLYKDGFYSNGIQGGIVPLATGLAFANKVSKNKNISIVFIGDGTLGEGVVYEAMNIASKWELPLLIVLEDNKFSQSTNQHESLSGEILNRARAFDIHAEKGSTWDWKELGAISKKMIEAMRQDSKPRFLQIETYRLKAHSKGDDNRPREIVDFYEKIDPINQYLAKNPDTFIVSQIKNRVSEAVTRADKKFKINLELNTQKYKDNELIRWDEFNESNCTRFIDLLNKSFITLMEKYKSIYFLGEDIESPYGGAFKATKDLSNLYPTRVKNTPISEACIVGIGVGMGLKEFITVVEIMFGDFIGLAFDQFINHLSKINQMYAGQIFTKTIIRTPMGGGRGYGPTHSQTLDKHFLGMPGLNIVALNNYINPQDMYESVIRNNIFPVLVIENKNLYSSFFFSNKLESFSYKKSNRTIPDFHVCPDSELINLTLIGYGGTADLLIQACDTLFKEYDIIAQVIIFGQIFPLNISPYLELINRSEGLIVVEEGQGFAGFGSEIISQVNENLDYYLKVRRIFAEPHCIPAVSSLEKSMLPSVDKIVECAINMVKE
jgi:2-oxoisovalerate dehydrogenase E1 component